MFVERLPVGNSLAIEYFFFFYAMIENRRLTDQIRNTTFCLVE